MDQVERKVIVLNGPPRAGKDTAIASLQTVFKDAEVFQFFRPIKELLHRSLGLDVSYDHYEELKDVVLPEFGGLTPRRAYIEEGDRLQREYGDHILTEIYFDALAGCKAPILITTCGMDSEGVTLAQMFGVDNTLFLRIHMEGKSFENDSRSWVHSDHLNIQDVHNVVGRVDDYQAKVAELARAFMDPREVLSYQAA